MKKSIKILSFIVLLILFNGCADVGNSVNSFFKGLREEHQKEVIQNTEDPVLVKYFIKNMPNAIVQANEIFFEKELNLYGKRKGQSTDINSDEYHPVRFFKRHLNDKTKMFNLWLEAVKQRGDYVVEYNANISKFFNDYIALPKRYPEEAYYRGIAPVYIEYNKDDEMISAFTKVLKTQEQLGGWTVEGHTPYFAYEYDVILLKPVLRDIQMNHGKHVFEDNEIRTISNIKKTKSLDSSTNTKEEDKEVNDLRSSFNNMIVQKFNKAHGTNFKTIKEIQDYTKKINENK